VIGGKQQRKAEQQRFDQQMQAINAAKGELDAWREGIPVDSLLAQAAQPSTSNTVSSSVMSGSSYTAPEVTKQFAPTLNMLQNAYTGRVAEADFLPQGLLESEYGNIAQEQQAGQAAEENLLRSRGVDPALKSSLLAVGPAARQASQARTAARQGAQEMKYQRKGQSLADLANLAQTWGRAQRSKQKSRTSGSSQTTQSANIGDALAVYNMTRPDVIIPS
jgi:hypothetical protein